MTGRPKGAGLGLSKGQPFPITERMIRFWSLVEKGKTDECWLWKGRVNNKGYGHFDCESSTVLAHRFSYRLAFGSYPSNCVLHKCDVRLCVNPDHLFSGTIGDNNRDMFRKGRGSPPPRWSRISTPEQVQQIRREYLGFGRSIRSTARKLNLSFKRVESAVYKWKSLPW
jgi:hypothetical protein